MAAGLHFSKTVEAGGFVFVSGQLGFDTQGAMAEGISSEPGTVTWSYSVPADASTAVAPSSKASAMSL